MYLWENFRCADTVCFTSFRSKLCTCVHSQVNYILLLLLISYDVYALLLLFEKYYIAKHNVWHGGV